MPTDIRSPYSKTRLAFIVVSIFVYRLAKKYTVWSCRLYWGGPRHLLGTLDTIFKGRRQRKDLSIRRSTGRSADSPNNTVATLAQPRLIMATLAQANQPRVIRATCGQPRFSSVGIQGKCKQTKLIRWRFSINVSSLIRQYLLEISQTCLCLHNY